jgi:hypothetical protein
MPIVDGSLGSLVQGVSQQPERARRPGQAEEQLNVRNDEVFGLSRRSPTVYGGALTGFAADAWDDAEQGFVVADDGQLLFWYAKGTTFKLMDPSDGSEVANITSSYLPSVAKGNVVVASIDGDIMVLNRQKTVLMNTAVVQDYGSKTLGTVVYARGGETGTKFSVVISDTSGTGTYTVKTSNSDPDETTAKYIVEQLTGLMDGSIAANGTTHIIATTGSFSFSGNYTATLVSNHILVLPTGAAGNSPKVTAEDGTGTNILVAVTDSVSEVGRLPLRARKNQVVKVAGAEADADDYYLRFAVDNASATDTFEDVEGVWVEDSSHDTDFRILSSTMPHVLRDSGSGYQLLEVSWKDKFAGDDFSNPNPAFVNDEIQDMIEFQERLVFLHGREVTMSQAQDVSNFFLQTATALLDDDTIHVVPTTGRKNATMRHAVSYNRDLVIFSDADAQFTISGRTKLTPGSASVALTAEFSMNVGIRPQAAGNVIFYGSTVGNHTEVSEMFLIGDQATHDRRSVSNHVPRYISGAVNNLVADDGNSFAILWDNTLGTPTEVFLYEYLWQGNQRVQSAWSQWDFKDKLIAATVQGATITLVFYQDANLPAYSATIDLARNSSIGLDFEVHLDRLMSVTGPTVTLPTLPDGYSYVAVQGAGNTPEGLATTMTETADNGSTKDYDVGAGAVLVGVTYLTRYVPSMPVIKDRAGIARAKSDLSVARFKIDTSDTGPFRMIRETTYEAPEDYWELLWEGFRWDDPDFVLGAVPKDSGIVEFTFEDNAVTSNLAIECDSYLPLNITEIEWEGSLRGRSTRVNTGG